MPTNNIIAKPIGYMTFNIINLLAAVFIFASAILIAIYGVKIKFDWSAKASIVCISIATLYGLFKICKFKTPEIETPEIETPESNTSFSMNCNKDSNSKWIFVMIILFLIGSYIIIFLTHYFKESKKDNVENAIIYIILPIFFSTGVLFSFNFIRYCRFRGEWNIILLLIKLTLLIIGTVFAIINR